MLVYGRCVTCVSVTPVTLQTPSGTQEERRKGQLSGAQKTRRWTNGVTKMACLLMEYMWNIYIYGIWGWYIIFNLDYIYILYGRFFWDDKLYINVDIDWYILYIFHHGSIPEFVALPAFTAVDAMNSALQNAEKHIRKVGTAALGRNPLKVGTSCDV